MAYIALWKTFNLEFKQTSILKHSILQFNNDGLKV